MSRNSSVSLKPFCYIFPSFNMITSTMLIVLVPQIIMLFITKSYQSLILLASSIFASHCAEALDKLAIRKKRYDFLIATFQGLVIGMFLPAGYPPVTIFFIVLVSLLISRYAFGGVASSWMNPVAITVIVSYAVGSVWFPANVVTLDHLQIQNTSLALIQEGSLPVHSFDSTITSFLNENIFSLIGISIPNGFVSLIWDSGSVIPAFRFNLLTLIASLFLFSVQIINWSVTGSFLLVYLILVRFFCPLIVGNPFGTGDIILALMTGGTLFTAFFVLTWFGTVPLTTGGKILFGSLAGIAAFFISGIGMSAAGAMFTVFSANILSLFIQMFEQRHCCDNQSVKQIVAERN